MQIRISQVRKFGKVGCLDAYDACADREVGLVLTFPSYKARNGLTALDFVKFGNGKFSLIEVIEVDSTFSTLGGGASNRGGRKRCTESIVCFRQ